MEPKTPTLDPCDPLSIRERIRLKDLRKVVTHKQADSSLEAMVIFRSEFVPHKARTDVVRLSRKVNRSVEPDLDE